MECALIREALSAHLDGEAAALPEARVDAHLEGCRACAGWAEELATLHRMVCVREAELVPDLSAAIVGAFVPASGGRGHARRLGPLGGRAERPTGSPLAVQKGRRAAGSPRLPASLLSEPISRARWALFVVALTQLVLAGPALFGDDSGATVHVAREAGSFGVALAVGLLVAAWQPGRAWGLLPLAAALVLVMAATSVLDVLDGRATALGECHHLLNLAGVAFLWLVAREARQAPTDTGHRTAVPA